MIWHIGIRNHKARVFLVAVVLLSAMLLPAVSFHPSLPSLRLEEFVLFGGWMVCLGVWAYGKGLKGLLRRSASEGAEELSVHTDGDYLQARRWVGRVVHAVILALVLSYAASNIYAVCFKGALFTFRDVMELVTFFKYYLVITLVISIRPDWGEWRFLQGAALAGMIILVGLGWVQHWDLAGFNTWMSAFLNPMQWEYMIFSLPSRAMGVFDNPNVYGMLAVILLAVLGVRYFFAEKSLKRFPLVLLLLMALLIKMEYLTLSRTALVGVAVLFTGCGAWALRRLGWNRKSWARIGVLLGVTLLLLTTAGDFLWRVGEGMDFENSTSMQGHILRWEEASGQFAESPVLGWGTQKSTMPTVVDNEYLLYLRRYGVVGLLAYAGFFLAPWVLAVAALRRMRTQGAGLGVDADSGGSAAIPERLLPAAAYVVVLPSILIYNFMAGIFYNLQIMTVLVMLMGFAYNGLIEVKCQERRRAAEKGNEQVRKPMEKPEMPG